MDDDLAFRLRRADQLRREASHERLTLISSFEYRLRAFKSILRLLHHDISRVSDRLKESVLIAQAATERLRDVTRP